MLALRVQICNERFLLRFGVDRILALLGEHLVGEGVEVSFACLRGDRAALVRITDRVDEIRLPDGLDLAAADDLATERLMQTWATARPDVLVTGGWPFFGAAARASAEGVRSLFIDAGAVPHDGLPASGLPSQLELRRLRQRTLPSIGCVLPISRFVQVSQTEPDRGHLDGVETVLLGADHMLDRRFDAGSPTPAERAFVEGLDELRQSGSPLIFLAGRFEPSGYKNSPAAFGILRRIKAFAPKAHLILLAGPDTVDVPADLRGSTTAVGTIGDRALQEAMTRSTLGLSLSLWEGFNLPLAEMQQLGKPVLAFNAGAHPEVIANPWFLCEDEAEMVEKAERLLAHGLPDEVAGCRPFETFAARFRWSGTLERWGAWIRGAADGRAAWAAAGRRLVLIDVTNAARDPGNSGVIRVTRRLSAELAAGRELDIVLVRWDLERSTYTLVDPSLGFLSSNGGPEDWLGATAARLGGPVPLEHLLRAADPRAGGRPILFLPEVVLDGSAGRRTRWAGEHGLAIAAIFHDMLPIYEARFVDAAVSAAFPSYVEAIAAADLILPNSDVTLRELKRYCAETELTLPGRQEAVWLPGQFGGHARISTTKAPNQVVEVLCVSTVEPRKNHRTLVAAFRNLRRRRPDLSVRLHLVGNLYAGAAELAEWVERATQEDDAIVWHRILSDADLALRYEKAAFTVYASLAEGFGLPIMESLWMGCPCICHEGGVMAELAAEGGCLMVDAGHEAQLSAAIEELATNETLRSRLAGQAVGRRIATWSDYADAIGRKLRAVDDPRSGAGAARHGSPNTQRPMLAGGLAQRSRGTPESGLDGLDPS